LVEKVIRLCDIVSNPYQTRVLDDEKEDAILRHQMRVSEMHVKPIVRLHPFLPGKYLLVDGGRRVKAAASLGWTEIEVQVSEYSEKEAAEATLDTNLQRKSLNPIEEAQGYRLLMGEFGYTVAMVAERYGKSRPYIANRLRLLEMPYFLKMGVLCKTLSPWQALSIMMLPLGYLHWILGSLAMDWSLTQRELTTIVECVKLGGYFFSWHRVVPVSGLWMGAEGESAGEDQESLTDLLDESEVVCSPDGYVYVGGEAVRRALAEGAETLPVRLLFEVDWLREKPTAVVQFSSHHADESKRGILPTLSLARALGSRVADYPVTFLAHSNREEVEEKSVVEAPARAHRAIVLGIYSSSQVGVMKALE
jgi:ParB/RepB/Spo0J family partition protein